MPIRAIVFDLFDTLVDLRLEDFPQVEWKGREFASSLRVLHDVIAGTADVEFDHFAETLFAVDRELRPHYYEQDVELPSIVRFEKIVERLGLPTPELPGVLTETHMSLFRQNAPAPDHHAEVLARLGERVRLGLCSNFTHAPTAHFVLETAGLATHLDGVVISETHGLRKPHPEIFKSVLAELEVAPDEALHVGDSLRADVAGAAALGIRTVWITRRIPDPEAALGEHSGPAPDHQIADLGELRELLDRV
ncbi:HAD family hydrolase [Myxococcota bacterium]|nr:HAD family hydrolase [Myxococcota bacterium]